MEFIQVHRNELNKMLGAANACEPEKVTSTMIREYPFRLIHCGPTVGKSHFIKQSGIDGNFTWTDSDLVTEEICPDFFKRRLYRNKDEVVHELVNSMVAFGVSIHLQLGHGVFTNLWHSTHFVERVQGFKSDGKIPISFMRSAEAAVELNKKRGGDEHHMTLDLVQMWLRSWLKYGHYSFSIMIQLGEGEYVSDLINLDGTLNPMFADLLEVHK